MIKSNNFTRSNIVLAIFEKNVQFYSAPKIYSYFECTMLEMGVRQKNGVKKYRSNLSTRSYGRLDPTLLQGHIKRIGPTPLLGHMEG